MLQHHSGSRSCTLPCTIPTLLVSMLLLLTHSEPVDAACSVTSQCPSHMVCQNTAIPGLKECKQQMCNSNAECPQARPSCHNGACMDLTGGSGSGGTGGTLAGEGQTCGPYKIGNVTKSRSCKPNLQCVNGRCQRPAQ